MDVADLRVFEAVSRLGSMNRAAQELNTVQSNVTARIRALEEGLGVSLFQRHARGVTTTAAGQRLLPFAPRLASLLAEAAAAAKDDGTPGGLLQIGSLETTAALRLSPLLSRFARCHPQVRLVVTTGTTARLLEDVLAFRVDGAFVAGPVAHPDLAQEKLFEEELVLVTAPSIVRLADLAALPDIAIIVFQLGCSYRQRLESLLAAEGILHAKPLAFGSLDAILSCVGAGVGITLLPRGVAARAADAGEVRLHSLPPAEARAETLFIRRRDAYLSSAAKAFLAMARTPMPAATGRDRPGLDDRLGGGRAASGTAALPAGSASH
jgi:DNA-binding transcriptional LysR family regulator